MATRFYKKSSPTNQPMLGNGTRCEFTTLDGLTAYFATDQAYVQDEFVRFMREGRYGLSEIEWGEFERDYVQKKTSGAQPKPLWREELSPSTLRPVPVPGAGAVAGDTVMPRQSAPAAAVAAVADAPTLPAMPKPKPVLGKRKARPTD